MPDEFELAAQRAREQVDGWLRQSQEQAEKAQRVSREVEAIRETETASDRTVTVTVDAGGRLVDLKLTREAMDLFPSDLATTILECVDKARSRAGAKASRLASEAWGEESDLAQRMRQAYSPRTNGTANAANTANTRDRSPHGSGIGQNGMIGFNRGGR